MVRPLISALLVLVASECAAFSQDERGSSAVEQVDAVLQQVQGIQDASRAAQQLADLPAPALEPLFARLARGEEGTARRAAILGAMARLPAERVMGFLGELARRGPIEPERRAALDLLARLGTSADLGLAFELGQPSEGSELPGLELRAALEGALVSILAREPGAGRILSDLFARVGPAARSVIVHALASARGGPTSALADLLGRAGGGSDAVVLLALGRTARRALPEPDLQVAERVRGYFTHPDPRLVVLAAAASAALADDAAVPDLIVLLEDEDANARTAALSALRELSAAPLEGESKAWLAWLDEGLAWWNDRADSCRVALVSGTPLEAAQALHEVARQRLYVRELVPLLQLAARRPEPDLARSACRALASLPPRLARASLLALVRMSEPGVAEAARASLARLRSAPKRAPRPILTLPQLEPIP